MYKLLQSNHIDHASKELAVGKIREVLQKSATHHSPAYAKLCHEVGLPAPLLPNNQTPHTPPTGKFGSHRGQQPHHLQSQQQYPHYNGPGYGPPGMPMGPHLTPGGPAGHHHPHTHNQHGHAGSPAFNFPSFGSPLSPAHRQASPGATSGGSPSPSSMYVPRQPSPYQPVYGGAAGADNHYAASYGSPYGMDSGYDMALRQQGGKQSHPPDGHPVQGEYDMWVVWSGALFDEVLSTRKRLRFPFAALRVWPPVAGDAGCTVPAAGRALPPSITYIRASRPFASARLPLLSDVTLIHREPACTLGTSPVCLCYARLVRLAS